MFTTNALHILVYSFNIYRFLSTKMKHILKILIQLYPVSNPQAIKFTVTHLCPYTMTDFILYILHLKNKQCQI